MKYGEVTIGQVEAVINKLGGMEGLRRFLADELMVKEAERQFQIFKTIKLGTGLRSADDFRKSLKDDGFNISEWADDTLGNPAFKMATKEIEVDLVVVSVSELGFKDGATREQIYKRAKELGLELCPSEVGPQLRLQYKDQSSGEWLLIAIEPITGSDGYMGVFSVRCRNSGLWLYSHDGNPDSVWDSVDRWVFVRPRK